MKELPTNTIAILEKPHTTVIENAEVKKPEITQTIRLPTNGSLDGWFWTGAWNSLTGIQIKEYFHLYDRNDFVSFVSYIFNDNRYVSKSSPMANVIDVYNIKEKIND